MSPFNLKSEIKVPNETIATENGYVLHSQGITIAIE